MIYITGDCHQDFRRFNTRIFPEQKEMTKEDYVIICGDFGGVWHKDKEDKGETALLDWLDRKSFTTLFVDGNHENFDRLNAYPVEKWNGGKVHKIRDSVIHLMRGQVYEIDFIVTHCCASGTQILLGGAMYKSDIETAYLEEIKQNVKFKKWFFGHYHDNRNVNAEEILLYEQIIRIS